MSMCEVNIALHRLLWELATVVPKQATVEQAQAIIRLDRDDPLYQQVIEQIREHYKTCKECNPWARHE